MSAREKCDPCGAVLRNGRGEAVGEHLRGCPVRTRAALELAKSTRTIIAGRCEFYGPKRAADVALWNAAPALLAACEALLFELTASPTSPYRSDVITFGRAAIAKARGGE